MARTRSHPEEPAAMGLLRVWVEGLPEERAAAWRQARELLRAVRVRRGRRATGRGLSRVTPAMLREMAARRAQGATQEEIAEALGVRRDLVAHHLRPSMAMLAAAAAEGAEHG